MAGNAPSKIELKFYQSGSGNVPVRDWLLEQPDADRKAIGYDLMLVQFGWPVGMPLCRSMKNGLWEVRTSLPSGKISRVMVCFHEGKLFALHGFIKKTQTTPDIDLKLARKRQKEVENG